MSTNIYKRASPFFAQFFDGAYSKSDAVLKTEAKHSAGAAFSDAMDRLKYMRKEGIPCDEMLPTYKNVWDEFAT